jgi:hypothetical protein
MSRTARNAPMTTMPRKGSVAQSGAKESSE